tara:strand:+ start:17482 stop:18378 length:897 start_codon:yes stop_codon:yes gene_type:complete
LKKIAAIDIGSNAVRMLICYVIFSGKEYILQKNAYLRLPLRLGEDTFNNGFISDNKFQSLTNALLSFKYIMKVHDVSDYQIYATSALRESENSNDIILKIKKLTGLQINLISGLEEAKIISNGNPKLNLDSNRINIFVDVGGGSTEFSIIKPGNNKKSKSFKVGTVRLLKNDKDFSTFDQIKKWLTSNIDMEDKIKLFASGGNINKIQSMTGSKNSKPITYLSIKNLYSNLIKHNYNERMIKYDLGPDRADVIIPALKIFIYTMESTNSNKIFVPKMGLVDGMINEIYFKNKSNKLDS